MMPIARGARSPIGIDLGSDRIKAAQVARAGQGWRITASLSITREVGAGDPSGPEIERLASLLEHAGFRGRRVILGAPRSMVETAVLDLPPRTSGAPIEQICAAEFARMFRLVPGAFELHAWEMPTSSDRATTTQMATTALESEAAERLVQPFEAAGLWVEAIDLPESATARASLRVCTEAGGMSALIDLGWAGVGLSVLRDGEAVYERWLKGAGVGALVASLARSIAIPESSARVLAHRVGLAGLEGQGVDPALLARTMSIVREFAEGLLQQVFGSVAYALDRFPGETIEHLHLCGGGTGVPDLVPYLAELTGLETAIATPRGCGFSGGRAADTPALLTALGHAIWGTTDA